MVQLRSEASDVINDVTRLKRYKPRYAHRGNSSWIIRHMLRSIGTPHNITTCADRYYNKIKEMIGYYPSSHMKYCWRFFTPSACFGILSLFLIKFSLLKYNNTYQYPWWGYAIGILLAFSSALLAPLWFLYSMAVTPGTLRQRLKTLCTPAADLCNTPPKRTLYPETPLSDTELHDLTEKP